MTILFFKGTGVQQAMHVMENQNQLMLRGIVDIIPDFPPE